MYILRGCGSSSFMKVIRIKVKVRGAKKCKVPYSCSVKLQSAIVLILQKIEPRCLRAAWGFPLRRMVWSPSLSRDWKWPRLSKYTHCQVIYFRLEGNLVFFLLFFFIHKHSDYNCYWWMQTSQTVMLHLHFTWVISVSVMVWICRQFIGGKDWNW